MTTPREAARNLRLDIERNAGQHDGEVVVYEGELTTVLDALDAAPVGLDVEKVARWLSDKFAAPSWRSGFPRMGTDDRTDAHWREYAADLIASCQPDTSTSDDLARCEAWLDRLGAAAGFGSLADVVQHQRDLGVTGREVPLQEKRVTKLEALIQEAVSFRDDAATFHPGQSSTSDDTTLRARIEALIDRGDYADLGHIVFADDLRALLDTPPATEGSDQ
jgi:hypothetical protein